MYSKVRFSRKLQQILANAVFFCLLVFVSANIIISHELNPSVHHQPVVLMSIHQRRHLTVKRLQLDACLDCPSTCTSFLSPKVKKYSCLTFTPNSTFPASLNTFVCLLPCWQAGNRLAGCPVCTLPPAAWQLGTVPQLP